tara:strand:- start:800 stop:1126 length:327 start_codon:yes stop_codon:yes gene_type:complete
MVKKHMRASDGVYHIHGKKFDVYKGSRAQVWHGTAYKTKGDLKKDNLVKNKHGNIVSKRKHNTAKKEKRLEKHGYFTKKGKFGYVKKDTKLSRKKSSTKKRRRRHRKN